MLASEGRRYSWPAIDRAILLAREKAVDEVAVLSIARVWGSAFGFPNPWLMPSRRELEEQRGYVAEAVKALRGAGIAAEGRVLGTRNAARRIAQEAARLECVAIVMAADPPEGWLRAEFSWSSEPYRVRRRAGRPVHLIVGGV